MRTYKLYFGGAKFGEVATYGWLITEDDAVILKGKGVARCPVPEYSALIYGLDTALEKGYRELVICGDSQLVIFQLNEKEEVGRELEAYYRKAKELLSQLKGYRLIWVPREINRRADELCVKAYAEHELERESKRVEEISSCEKGEHGLYYVDGHRVKPSPPFYCECSEFKSKNSPKLFMRAGIRLPCKHIAYVYHRCER